MIPLTNKEIKFYEKQKVCYICEKMFCADKNKKSECKLYHKVRDHCHYTGKFRGAAHYNCNLRHNVPKEIPIVFHNGSTYDYHFVIKKLAEEFKNDFECLGENIEKYVTVSVPLKKEHDNDETITYKLKSIDSYRFIQSSLSNLVDNLSEVYDKECKKCMERKKIKVNCEFIGFKNGRLNYKCKECKKSCTKVLNSKIFLTLYKFCNGDLNEFLLLLRKSIYPYEYMDSWERFDENTI